MGMDNIAEILTFIRNANRNGKKVVKIPSTNIIERIVKLLLREGFLENVRKHRENSKNFLVLTFRHRKRTVKNHLNLKQISRPGLRIYSKYKKIPKILGGMGIIILSTSQGLLTDREARLKRIGGEILCYIW
uniref:ribosomal protein S8 n=1 Tax=Cuscuta indecora TaxID=267559 RepID=UPI002435FDC7|nr:ribosomal protein S8 [Cuscuta indecora]WEY30024.1 ribosomal protein S8 [Cuscuta indecora]